MPDGESSVLPKPVGWPPFKHYTEESVLWPNIIICLIKWSKWGVTWLFWEFLSRYQRDISNPKRYGPLWVEPTDLNHIIVYIYMGTYTSTHISKIWKIQKTENLAKKAKLRKRQIWRKGTIWEKGKILKNAKIEKNAKSRLLRISNKKGTKLCN